MELGFEILEEMAAEVRMAVERLQRFVAAKRGSYRGQREFQQVEIIRRNPHETVVIRNLDGSLANVIYRGWDAALGRLNRRYTKRLNRIERRVAELSATRERLLREWNRRRGRP